MSNILKNYNIPIDFRLIYDEYWDFCLNTDVEFGNNKINGLQTRCLISYIDINDPNCVWFDKLYSNCKYTWSDAINNGVNTDYIGFTGVDNGYIHYQKDRISNQIFYNLFTNSNLTIKRDDKRMKFSKVYGNNMIYDYSNNIVEEDGILCARLNGGFYQGFFKLNGFDYQVLPDEIGDGLCFEIMLKKSDFIKENDKLIRLNDRHIDNKGIFFYIGTRAENKWWINYDVDTNFDKIDNGFLADGYVNNEYTGNNHLNDNYIKPHADTYNKDGYFSDDYLSDKKISECCCKLNSSNESISTIDNDFIFTMPEYLNTYKDNAIWFNKNNNVLVNNEKLHSQNFMKNSTFVKSGVKEICDGSYLSDEYVNDDYVSTTGGICDMYVKHEYYNDEKQIDENEIFYTSDGYDFNQPNIYEIKTDNKFIFFNHTDEGFTIKNWNDNYEVILSDIKIPDMENYFMLFNHTENGYTVNTIDKLINEKNKKYDVLDDIFKNGLAFQIKDDGCIGYKYMVRDCDSEIKDYKIEKEYSKPIIKDNEWYTVHVKIYPINKYSMRLSFYVNGKLCLVSKELPLLQLKPLNDLNDKQVGVPFNMSLGGGTQGLCDVVYLNYRKLPEYILPLEKEFAGTFIGFVKSFKIYNCIMGINDIRENYNFELISMKQ